MEGDRHPARLAVTETREQILEQLAVAGARAPRVLGILASFAELNRMPADGAATGPVLREDEP